VAGRLVAARGGKRVGDASFHTRML
jgi:hypothetical protein